MACSSRSTNFCAPFSPSRSPRLLAACAAVTDRHQRVAVSQPSPSPAWLSPDLRTPWQRPPIAAAGRLPPVTLFGLMSNGRGKALALNNVTSGTPAQRALLAPDGRGMSNFEFRISNWAIGCCPLTPTRCGKCGGCGGCGLSDRVGGSGIRYPASGRAGATFNFQL